MLLNPSLPFPAPILVALAAATEDVDGPRALSSPLFVITPM